ncbi:MAG: hypothetical protein Q8L47_03845, partial [bacterium]|nr:hypothetical protein [bacterium]
MLRNNKGQFIKGHKPIPLTEEGKKRISESSKGNNYGKGNPPNKTSFKKGQVAPNKGRKITHSGSFKKGHKFCGGEKN